MPWDEFAYRACLVRAGVRASTIGGVGWYGIVHLIENSQETTFALVDRLFDWPAAARDHAAQYARRFIDERLEGRALTVQQRVP
jgi:hypothetical protein